MVNVGPLTAETGSGVRGTPAISTGIASWLRYYTDVAQDVWPSPRLVHYAYIFGVLAL